MCCIVTPFARFGGRLVALVFGGLLAQVAAAGPLFQTNDSVALLGGASVVSVDRAGLLETVLILTHPGHRLRFRTLAWEGDNVFSRPRELNFPSVTNLLHNSRATATCVEFGALEALDRSVTLDAFREGYRHLLDEIVTVCPRVVLVLPAPFEPKPPPFPDFSAANERLDQLGGVIRRLADERRLPLVDVHREFRRQPPTAAWTHDGRELTPQGHRLLAAAWARQCGQPDLAERVRTEAFWQRPEIEALAGAVRDKNRLWFHYWRPMNWAFLAGDRTEQQASRDHRDPKIRWFPAEMEQYPPLIAEAEIRIESLAAQIRTEP